MANTLSNTPADKNWKAVHEELVVLATKRAELDADEGRCLLAALRAQVHVRLGYGSFQEYVERLFGYGPRFVAERLRVARALEDMPKMQRAVATGALCWSAARELTRVATAQTQDAWLQAAQGKSVREIEQLVAGLAPGARPGDRPQPENERHVLRLELSAETWATYREAVAKLQRTSGEPLDEDAALLLMARTVLEGSKDSGRCSYQIALRLCPHCNEAVQQGRGEAVPVGAEVVEMAACDAQALPPAVAPASSTDASGALTTPAQHERATQSIPPAVRREVMRRDGGRCCVPGCRNATFLDVHHVVPRADGGTHDPQMMTVLCAAHHRAAHRGALLIEGSASAGFRFLHADGSPYGNAAMLPAVTEAMRDSFLALRHLGFGERQVKAALATVRTRNGATPPTNTAEVTRAALQLLTGRAPTWVQASRPAAEREDSSRLEVREVLAVYYAAPTWGDRLCAQHPDAVQRDASMGPVGMRAA